MGWFESGMLDRRRARAVLALFASAALLALTACETPPGKEATVSAAKDNAGARAPTPAPAVHAAPAPPAPEPPPPPPPGTAQRLVVAAIELLEAGNEEQAAVELQRALQAEPGHRLAQNLLRQINGDPVAMLGRESFTYRVQPGESLSRIAQRFLGDVHQFYILARYNDIKVPRQLAGGQMIRIPGKAPPASVATPPPAAGSPTPPVTSPPAPPVAAGPPAPPVAAASAAPPPTRQSSPADAARAERERVEGERVATINRLTRAARAAFARQDLDAAIRHWDQVLELDADSANAKLERQRAIDLKERLKKVR